MRGLFRSALALFALGIGCGKSGETPPPQGGSGGLPEATFHVPGMS
jgi:hypothetical protein